jgi:predicted dehydrogenase
MRYARHLLEPLPKARLVAVCRRDIAAGKAFADHHALRFHPHYQDLIADPAVQAIVVVTPPSLTRPICLEAVRARKPILIEKPLATCASEAAEMVHAAESSGVPLMTAQTLRFEAVVQALKAERGSVGTPQYLVLSARAVPRPEIFRDPADYAGRGVLLEIGVHLLDLVRYLTGEEVAEVRCELRGVGRGKPEHLALASLRATSGLGCIIEVSRLSTSRTGRLEWIGGEGQMTADWIGHRLSLATPQAVKEWTVRERPTVVAALEGFVTALERGDPMPVTGLDGQRAVELADACYESAATGRAVRVG